MANAQPEPSMEEILASIRRIISEDDEPGEGSVAQDDATPAPAALAIDRSGEDDAGGQSGEIQNGETQNSDVAEGAPEDTVIATAAVFENVEEGRHDATDESPSPSEAAADRPAVQEAFASAATAADVAALKQDLTDDVTHAADSDDAILGDASASLASQAFQSLSQSVRVSQPGDGRTLEDIVVDMLRPMIREWLDENLPAIVEEKVEAEVRRIARQRR